MTLIIKYLDVSTSYDKYIQHSREYEDELNYTFLLMNKAENRLEN